MELLKEARDFNEEIQPKLEKVTTLTAQARKLLAYHGEPLLEWSWAHKLISKFDKTFQPHKKITREIEGIEVQIFSLSRTGSGFILSERSTIVVSIPTIQKNLVLQGEKSTIRDYINNPDSPTPLSRISLADLNAWGDVVQSVEDSFRSGQ